MYVEINSFFEQLFFYISIYVGTVYQFLNIHDVRCYTFF
jgi:hypothetical protein